jgi:hypothetical protein
MSATLAGKKILLFLINLITLPILIFLNFISILVDHFLHPIKYLQDVKQAFLDKYNDKKNSNKITKVLLGVFYGALKAFKCLSYPLCLLSALIIQPFCFEEKHLVGLTVLSNFGTSIATIHRFSWYDAITLDTENLDLAISKTNDVTFTKNIIKLSSGAYK